MERELKFSERKKMFPDLQVKISFVFIALCSVMSFVNFLVEDETH